MPSSTADDNATAPVAVATTAERARLVEANRGTQPWRDWGPYLSERAWGTVREDYSADGDAWDFFPHDHARSPCLPVERGRDGRLLRRYADLVPRRWRLWNGVDPILKERMFGLTGPQGNHGEDVKEYWWYLDGTPDPFVEHLAVPLPAARVPVRRPHRRERRSRQARARVRTRRHRASSTTTVTGWSPSTTPRPRPHDLLMHITVENAGPDAATIARPADVVVPQHLVVGLCRSIRSRTCTADVDRDRSPTTLAPAPWCWLGDGDPDPLFCENETNTQRFFGVANRSPYPKDGINDHVVTARRP